MYGMVSVAPDATISAPDALFMYPGDSVDPSATHRVAPAGNESIPPENWPPRSSTVSPAATENAFEVGERMRVGEEQAAEDAARAP
jgi:hypothetical protein